MSDAPVCAFEFDGVRCRKRGQHRCVGRVKHVTAFFTEALCHTKGDYAGKPFVPARWQRDEVLAPLFGEVVWDDNRQRYVRRFRVLYLSVARKNGKSELVAGIVLYLLVADDEVGAEIYGLALDLAQAGLVFRVAHQMVRRSTPLHSRLKVIPGAVRIVDESTGSLFTVIPSDADGTLGLNPSGAYIDELLTQPSRELFDALRTGMGARAQPLICLVTTAEANETSFAASERQWSERIQADPDLEPERLVVIYAAPEDADWTSPDTWRLANPALGDFLEMRTLANECRSAQHNPVEERVFRQYRLNQPGRSVGLAINLPEWQASAGDVDWRDMPTRFEGRQCFGGMDLSATSDIAAYCLAFPEPDGGYSLLWRHFIPSASLMELSRRTSRAAPVWVGNSGVLVTDGNVTDYAAIHASLDADRDRFDIVEVGLNKWQAVQLAGELVDDDWPIIATGQGYGAVAGPTSDMLRLIGLGLFHHGGNPVAQWQAANAVTRTDPNGNIRFDKSNSLERIEGLSAAVLAIDRAIRHEQSDSNFAVVGFR